MITMFKHIKALKPCIIPIRPPYMIKAMIYTQFSRMVSPAPSDVTISTNVSSLSDGNSTADDKSNGSNDVTSKDSLA